MKKLWIMAVLALLLTGCGAEETFETVADDLVQSVMAQPRQITVELPDNAVSPVLESGSEQMYICEDYEILIETAASGDLDGTIERLCGYSREELTVLETQWDGVSRYEFVWASAGENGERLGRAVVLDDGSYHYCMSVLRDVDAVGTSQIVWNNVFASFDLL